MCVETAQSITSLIIKAVNLDGDQPIGLLPWWYRIYFLHIAGTIFLAAMFVPNLVTESVLLSWQDVLSNLRKHEHLSKYVTQCIATFETLSSRILASATARNPPTTTTDDHSQGDDDKSAAGAEWDPSATSFFDDFIQDVGFDLDGALFDFGDDGI